MNRLQVPGIEVVREAHARILPYVHHTPVERSASLDRIAGADVYMKCEHLQRGGAFKFRGACNAVLGLSDDDAAHGVATHSSGNHGAALALAARIRGIPARVVMPDDASAAKRAAVVGYGAVVESCGPSLPAREAGLRDVVARSGAAVVHPYDDWRVIAGQGTAALELLETVPEIEVLMVPVGGGGLVSGTAITARGLSPALRVIGVRPSAAPDTVADGLRASTGRRNDTVIAECVDGLVTVSDEAIVEAMRWFWERTKMLIEPSAATVIAALHDERIRPAARRIGVILSGGNVDLDRLPWR